LENYYRSTGKSVFLASFSGVLVGISGITIPTPIMMPIELLGNVEIPTTLLSIGASMNWNALIKINRFAAFMNFIKLIAMPMIALIFGFLFD
jgi:predicted permease|tara:strand:+ start:9560 stop:9835 length:276 start_codon:yes stop_codon:yes gene_type:complete